MYVLKHTERGGTNKGYDAQYQYGENSAGKNEKATKMSNIKSKCTITTETITCIIGYYDTSF